MKWIASVLAGLVVFTAAAAQRPAPSPALAARLKDKSLDIIGIIHFGLNTFTDREWGFGDEDPGMFNPEKFDADQIVAACKAGGIGGLVVVAKHHDGFCLWPTKTTGHNLKASPWRDGKGDYIREMSDACRKAGLKFGIYVSPWDRNSEFYSTDRYVCIFHRQLKELMKNYGELFEIWFDGANGGTGWYGGAKEKRSISKDYYRYGKVGEFIRELQPGACSFGQTDWAEFRWPGNERGLLPPECRSTMPSTKDMDHYNAFIASGLRTGVLFQVPEADFPLRKGWFYHERENGTTKSGEMLMRLYLASVGNGGIMNIGVAPNKSGLVDEVDARELKRFSDIRREFFAREVTGDGEFNVVVFEENLLRGEQVDEWRFHADSKVVLSGKSIGLKRIRVLDAPVKASSCRFECVRHGGDFRGVVFRRYYVDPLLIKKINDAGTTSETQTAVWMKSAAANKDERKKK